MSFFTIAWTQLDQEECSKVKTANQHIAPYEWLQRVHESCTDYNVKVTHLLIKEVQLHHDLKDQSSHAQSCKTSQQNNLICTYCKLHLTR